MYTGLSLWWLFLYTRGTVQIDYKLFGWTCPTCPAPSACNNIIVTSWLVLWRPVLVLRLISLYSTPLSTQESMWNPQMMLFLAMIAPRGAHRPNNSPHTPHKSPSNKLSWAGWMDDDDRFVIHIVKHAWCKVKNQGSSYIPLYFTDKGWYILILL